MKIESAQIKFLKAKNENLEKQVEQLKQLNKSLETQLSFYMMKDDDKKKIELASKTMTQATEAKDAYETLNEELKAKIAEANELIKGCRKLLNKEGDKFEKQVNKEIERMKSWNN